MDSPDLCSLTLPFDELFAYHMVALPVMMLAAVLVLLLLWPVYKNKMGKEALVDSFFAFSNLAMFCLYPGLAQRIFQAFRCTPTAYFPEETWHLTSDLNIRCFIAGESGAAASEMARHSSLMASATVFMFVYVVGIPLFMFLVLFTNRKVLHNPKHPKFDKLSKRFGSFYRMYEGQFWCWELVETVYKVRKDLCPCRSFSFFRSFFFFFLLPPSFGNTSDCAH